MSAISFRNLDLVAIDNAKILKFCTDEILTYLKVLNTKIVL